MAEHRQGKKREAAASLRDIFTSCETIMSYAKGVSFAGFIVDRKLQDAIERRLITIGEATKNITEEIKRRHPSIEWKKMAGMRDVFTHHYWSLDASEVWGMVTKEIPSLKAELEGDPDLGG